MFTHDTFSFYFFMNKLNHLTSGFTVWLQVHYLYEQLTGYYLEKRSTLKTFIRYLNLSWGTFEIRSSYWKFKQTKNPLYIILNQLFYDSYSFWYLDSDMYISDFLFWTVAWQTYFHYHIFHNLILHLWITSSSYTCYQNLSLKYFGDNSRVSGIYSCGEHYLSFTQNKGL